MANWPGDHVGTSEKCAKPVVLDAYLQTLELWNRQRVNKLLGLQIELYHKKTLPCSGNCSWMFPAICEEPKENTKNCRIIFVHNWCAATYRIFQFMQGVGCVHL